MRKTISSRVPCPFCRGRRWIPWYVGGDVAFLDVDAVNRGGEREDVALVDLGLSGPPHLFDDGLADECDGCGAVAAEPVGAVSVYAC